MRGWTSEILLQYSSRNLEVGKTNSSDAPKVQNAATNGKFDKEEVEIVEAAKA